MPHETEPKRLFVYGSCVSRDVIRVFPERFQTHRYVARQSWISAFAPPTPVPDRDSGLSSPFQERTVRADFSSSAPDEFVEHAAGADVVFLDLVDERDGVVPTPEGYVTNSWELSCSDWKSSLDMEHVLPLGSEEHFRLWAAAARKLKVLLQDAGLWEKTFVVEAPYATRTDRGGALPPKRGKTSEEWNQTFAPYYAFLQDLGFRLIKVPDEVVVTDSEHLWGIEPFHYVDGFYDKVADVGYSSAS